MLLFLLSMCVMGAKPMDYSGFLHFPGRDELDMGQDPTASYMEKVVYYKCIG